MLQQLLLAFALASMTVALHALGTVYFAIPAAGVLDHNSGVNVVPRPMLALPRLVSFLLILHLLEMTCWAAAYTFVGVLPDFESSLYYSSMSYTTVGYGDVLPPNSWRLLGPIEAAVGVLMLGWSTGVIVAAVQRIYNSRRSEHATPGSQ